MELEMSVASGLPLASRLASGRCTGHTTVLVLAWGARIFLATWGLPQGLFLRIFGVPAHAGSSGLLTGVHASNQNALGETPLVRGSGVDIPLLGCRGDVGHNSQTPKNTPGRQAAAAVLAG